LAPNSRIIHSDALIGTRISVAPVSRPDAKSRLACSIVRLHSIMGFRVLGFKRMACIVPVARDFVFFTRVEYVFALA
jgi:hypothetical protein